MVQSEIEYLTLKQRQIWDFNEKTAMYGEFTQSPKYPGDKVTLSVYADTGNDAKSINTEYKLC